ncbi:hypothetical protein [uncultured Neisseria sp.]|uniref:hypothetical protein n=1 Tax=uncultured Neisseria sp. TaxID=237778 RepID=UPI0028043CD4|nr:hypothetical protein [uncultured Neisseria sp.]
MLKALAKICTTAPKKSLDTLALLGSFSLRSKATLVNEERTAWQAQKEIRATLANVVFKANEGLTACPVREANEGNKAQSDLLDQKERMGCPVQKASEVQTVQRAIKATQANVDRWGHKDRKD